MKLIGGYQFTKPSGEDLPLTPYLFLVHTKVNKSRIVGLGVQIFYHAFYIGLGFNLPKKIKTFNNHTLNKKEGN